MSNVLIGLSGHIDHGKTTFIEKLTNKNLDTLPEEKERLMTIDIGFTDLVIGDEHIGLIDVPGHEKFIKNMATGISSVNFVILIIACDDGIMPQTIEHFEIIKLLGINHGIVVLTKKDMVTRKRFEEVKNETNKYFSGTFLENNIYSVDINDLSSYELIKDVIKEKIKDIKINKKTNFRMNIDRNFNVHGVGTILTGTIASGNINLLDEKTIYPSMEKVRIKNIQNHGKDVSFLDEYKRCAINISGTKEKIKRGNVLADFLFVSSCFDVKVYLLPEVNKIKTNHRVRVHLGTSEVIGRLTLLDGNNLLGGNYKFAKLVLDSPIPIDFEDVGIIRNYSPITTIGSIKVLNPHSKIKNRYDKDYLKMLNDLDSKNLLETRVYYSMTDGINKENLEKLKKNNIITKLDKTYIHNKKLFEIREKIKTILEEFYAKNHLEIGMNKLDLVRMFDYSLKDFDCILDDERFTKINDKVKLSSYKIRLNKEEKNLKEIIFKKYKEMKFNLIPYDGELETMHKYMASSGFIIYLGENYYILNGFMKEIKKILDEYFMKNSSLTVKEFRELLNIKRNIAIILLEYLDKDEFTVRVGDSRRKK